MSLITDSQWKVLNSGEFFKDSLVIGSPILEAFELIAPKNFFDVPPEAQKSAMPEVTLQHKKTKMLFQAKVTTGKNSSYCFLITSDTPWENPNPTFTINSDGEICNANAAAQILLTSLSEDSHKMFDQLILNVHKKLKKNAKTQVRAEFDKNFFDIFFQYHKSQNSTQAFFSNVTEEVHAQQQLEDERTANLSQNNILAVGEMASGVSHEINNPLAIIRASISQLIKNQVDNTKKVALDPEKVMRSYDRISRAADRIGSVAEGLRTFARNASDDPKQEEFFDNIIREAISLYEEKFTLGGFKVQTQIESHLLTVCRKTQMINALFQLLNNSFEALSGGLSPWIHIEASKKDEWIEITVTDSGSGIPSHLRNKIMEPFFTTKSLGKGLGLGLSTAKGIIESHGGTLSYSSDHPNTRFIILLPQKAIQKNSRKTAA